MKFPLWWGYGNFLELHKRNVIKNYCYGQNSCGTMNNQVSGFTTKFLIFHITSTTTTVFT